MKRRKNRREQIPMTPLERDRYYNEESRYFEGVYDSMDVEASPSEIVKEFVYRLKSKGIKAYEIADLLKVHKNTLSHWVQKSPPPDVTIMLMKMILKIIDDGNIEELSRREARQKIFNFLISVSEYNPELTYKKS